MKPTWLVASSAVAISLSFSLVALASEPAPPPPGINDKGVESAVEPPVDLAPAETFKPEMPDTRLVRDKASRSKNPTAVEIEASSDAVSERKEGTDTVTEYRQKGKLRMVRIAPEDGAAKTYYDRNGDGRLDKDPMEGPVAPVYFTIYEWD